MSREFVKKSLYKFLDDNLDYYITYDSKKSNLLNISDLVVNTDYVYTAPVKIDEIEVYFGITKFTTLDNIVGRKLMIYDELDEVLLGSDVITGIDSVTKAIQVQTGFVFDILTTYKITILQESLIYLRSPYGILNTNTRLHSLGQKDRYDLILKAKDDSDKEKINTMLQDIRNLIFKNNCSFKIYNDLSVNIGYTRMLNRDYNENEMLDISNDIQSFLVSFVVEYFINYK